MASTAAAAPSMRPPRRQFGVAAAVSRAFTVLERWLEAERDQLALWVPVAMGTGVATWFLLPDPQGWTTAGLAFGAIAAGAFAAGRGDRTARLAGVAALSALLGLCLVWVRAERVAAPVLGGRWWRR